MTIPSSLSSREPLRYSTSVPISRTQTSDGHSGRHSYHQHPPTLQSAIEPRTNSNHKIRSLPSTLSEGDTEALAQSDHEPTPHTLDHPQILSSRRTKSDYYASFRWMMFNSGSSSFSSDSRPEKVIKDEVQSRDLMSIHETGTKHQPGPSEMRVMDWRKKSSWLKRQVKRFLIEFRGRISSQSPESCKPRSWNEYDLAYAGGRIDINDPPLPPTEANLKEPTPYQKRYYVAPRHPDESSQHLLLKRLGVFGKDGFDHSIKGSRRAQEREELVERLEKKNRLNKNLSVGSENVNQDQMRVLSQTQTSIEKKVLNQISDLTTIESLEQHPIFLKIVKECRKSFGASFSMLSIIEKDRQLFLAESGCNGTRTTPRQTSLCSHTILSGGSGFTVSDLLKDWRFENCPGVRENGLRFYAGVPLMVPKIEVLKASGTSEVVSCPIGTLCIFDSKPRDDFGTNELQKLVSMAEEARQEIEAWFFQRMELKVNSYKSAYQSWLHDLNSVGLIDRDRSHGGVCGQESQSGNLLGASLSHPSSKPRPSFTNPEEGTSEKSLTQITTTSSLTPGSGLDGLRRSPSAVRGRTSSVRTSKGIGLQSHVQKAFDLATSRVGKTLEVELVQLIAIEDDQNTSRSFRSFVLSSNNSNLIAPDLDYDSYHQGLHSSSGTRLTYYEEKVKKASSLKPKDLNQADHQFSSMILIRIGPVVRLGSGGFLLVCFSQDLNRVYGIEDVMLMKKFSNQLARYIVEVEL